MGLKAILLVSPKTGRPYREQSRKQKWWSRRNWCKLIVSGIIGSISYLIHRYPHNLTERERIELDEVQWKLKDLLMRWNSRNAELKGIHDV